MKAHVLVLASMWIVASMLPAQPVQASDAEDATSPAGQETYTRDPTLQLGTDAELTRACQAGSLGKAAFAYCSDFARLLIGPDPGNSHVRRLVNIGTDTATLAQAFASYKLTSDLHAQEEKALTIADQNALAAAANISQKRQVGSPAASSGSTSLVAKPLITNLLQFAAETGAFTQTQSGNTITVQTNLDHLFREAFTLEPQLSYLPKGTPYLENLTASVGLAVNTNNSITTPASGSATSSPIDVSTVLANTGATKLSSVSANYEFNNKLTQGYLQKYLAKTNRKHLFVEADPTTAPAVYRAQGALINDLVKSSVCPMETYEELAQKYSDVWKSAHGTNAAPPSADLFEPFVTTFDDCFDKGIRAAGPTFQADWAAYIQAMQADIASFQKSLRDQISGWDAAFHYVYHQPQNEPATHDFRFVANGDLSKGARSTWNANGDVTIYHSVPAGAKYNQFKNAQFSAEFGRTFGTGPSASTISVAGYGQYQDKPSVLNITSASVPSGVTLPPNAQVFLTGTDGWIGVVQAKYTVHIGSAQIPVGVKWSNKTNLLNKSKVGAQFGISYDFSQLKQLFGLGSNSGN